MTTLSTADYRDKVYACWLGKNCGGTLGAPLEHMYTQDEPFNIDWYPELREGGIPNDDLEMQLIWLKAVEEVGFDLSARDLAHYWLDHIGYNWDEYGLNKTNLRLGLLPPVSGYFNNWFNDCMGSPIRSEIWACLCPGAPALAVRYAYEDASVDHAGGEGVWGEVFNAAVQSAAFVESNPQTLLEIGLSYIPATCGVARAVRAARQAHADGVGWQEARSRVRAATPSYNAQYAPPNIGFQVIGWLYGRDFGDAICTAVNCGHDTDCTGATLGALLGILGGRAGLPERWTAPLGTAISTNESWGGLSRVSTGPNPIPTTLDELTDRVCTLGPRLLVLRNAPVTIAEGVATVINEQHALVATVSDTAWLAALSPLRLDYTLGSLSATIAYSETPTIAADTPIVLTVQLRNRRSSDLIVSDTLQLPPGWRRSSDHATDERVLVVGATATLSYSVQAPAAQIHNSNRLQLTLNVRGRPAEPALPIVLVGARRWLLWGPHSADESEAMTLLDRPFAPEDDLTGVTLTTTAAALSAGWQIAPASGNALPDALSPEWHGVAYARLYLWSEGQQEIHLGIPGTGPRKAWLNGDPVHEVREITRLRPNYGGDGVSYRDITLRHGWNALLIKYTRAVGDPGFAAHLTLSSTVIYHGLYAVEWTRLPWEAEKVE